ncbi:MAG: AAA family ATPase [Candidatus Micrarchaeota archaeon]|nr:AAA family ATPase [Candidatus Micrarchaeota archaeon]
MGKLFGEKGTGLFRNENALLPDYLPDDLPNREKELKEIAACLRPIAEGGRPENLIIVGPTGVGKTSCARYVLRELSAYTRRALPLYINCWEVSTRHAILGMLATSLGEILPRRGIATDEITERIVEMLKKEKKVPVIVLDEVDRLVASPYGEENVLYDLARAKEIFGVDIALIGITNRPAFLANLDGRIKSSLAQARMEFAPYSPAQLKAILAERAKIAFVADALDADVIPLCAAIGAKNGGDARVAIAALWKAGKSAERKGTERVAVENVKDGRELGKVARELGEVETRIIEIIDEFGSVTSGELYEKLGMNERTVRNYLTKLEKMNLIETTEVRGEGRGMTRIIKKK